MASAWTSLIMVAVPGYTYSNILVAARPRQRTVQYVLYVADSAEWTSGSGSICCRQCRKPVRQWHDMLPTMERASQTMTDYVVDIVARQKDNGRIRHRQFRESVWQWWYLLPTVQEPKRQLQHILPTIFRGSLSGIFYMSSLTYFKNPCVSIVKFPNSLFLFLISICSIPIGNIKHFFSKVVFNVPEDQETSYCVSLYVW